MRTPTNLENTDAQDDPDGHCRIPVEEIQGPQRRQHAQRNRQGGCNGRHHHAFGKALSTARKLASHAGLRTQHTIEAVLGDCASGKPTEPGDMVRALPAQGAVAGVDADHVRHWQMGVGARRTAGDARHALLLLGG
jgi:hypothetical protein